MPLELATETTEIKTSVKVLSGHTSPETSFLQPDYPYGRTLRCKRKVWVETATKGSAKGKMRFVHQTSNPRKSTESWNKPHAEQYRDFLLMYVNPENGHVETAGVDVYSVEEVQKFKARWYALLDEDQKAKLDEVEQRTVAINNYWSRRSRLTVVANGSHKVKTC